MELPPSAKPMCSACKKTENEIHLLRCGKCKSILYCTPECQQTHWETHKPLCSSPQTRRIVGYNKPFHGLRNNTWLKGRPELDVFTLLIDVYRLRMSDAGQATDEAGLQQFLTAAYACGLLPAWWSPEKELDCLCYSRDGAKWSDLTHPKTYKDIITHYKSTHLEIQLRVFGEGVYGPQVGLGAVAKMATVMLVVFGECGGGAGKGADHLTPLQNQCLDRAFMSKEEGLEGMDQIVWDSIRCGCELWALIRAEERLKKLEKRLRRKGKGKGEGKGKGKGEAESE